ncbi:hypothetical protein CC85DRAFT_327319 [Cutaneotrichosporon oleaginosum]|uniref:Uncharacterized protein n=1 Tax=Cutaneotrichosporon oleaginosum TaxID=879819 RepID=A0A0J0XQK9_9TREE|nr:uncharacterized protein CC85DRAFT_327319 [Cutaneotrichosporon oleaginosum]KLT43372.1 hypothetical protein CC85DRAFT_327319 [Cutaneotrichosporon oleaginosum]
MQPKPNMMPPSMVPMGMPGPGAPGMVPIHGRMQYQLPPGYELQRLPYTPDRGWGAWDLASHHYSGSRLERTWLNELISRISEFVGARQLSEDAAYQSFVRVYYKGDGADAGNRSLGGAAAYQAYLLWCRDHWPVYAQNSHESNMMLIAGMAVAELHRLWDVVDPRSSRAKLSTASEYAAATVRYLYDRHFVQSQYGAQPTFRPLYARRRRDSDSSSASSNSRRDRRHSRRYDEFIQPHLMMQPGMQPGVMQAGVMQPGMQPGVMQSGMISGVPMQPGMQPGMQYAYAQPYAACSYQCAPVYAGYVQPAYVAQAGAQGYYPVTAGGAYYAGVDPNVYRDPNQVQYAQGYYSPQAYGYPQQGYRYY